MLLLLLFLFLFLLPPLDDDDDDEEDVGGRDGPKEILTSVPPRPVVRFSTDEIRLT